MAPPGNTASFQTFEQLSHLYIVPRFLPLPFLIVIPAADNSPLGAEGFMSWSSSSSLMALSSNASDAVKRPTAEVNEVEVCGTACGGVEPDNDRVASEFRAAAAVCIVAALFHNSVQILTLALIVGQ